MIEHPTTETYRIRIGACRETGRYPTVDAAWTAADAYNATLGDLDLQPARAHVTDTQGYAIRRDGSRGWDA